jgi:indolepyruvate ferredoxin oxidoreductase beta subunit
MTYDIILCGVGGQGVLSLAAIIAMASKEEGLQVRQAEVHGMAQRGGAVMSHLRISDGPIYSDLVSKGGADMILSMEPLESLRYTDYLKPEGVVVTSSIPFINIPNYPELEEILNKIKALPKSVLIDSKSLAKEVGNLKAGNMIMVGGGSNFLPLSRKSLEKAVSLIFGRKGQDMVDKNIQALELGAKA